MAASSESHSGDSSNPPSNDPDDRLKKLYPAVNEAETPLPHSWSAKDKFNYLGLSKDNLRVHYKGILFLTCLTSFHSLVIFGCQLVNTFEKFT